MKTVTQKLYAGCDSTNPYWTQEEKGFWQDKADEYTPVWKVRLIDGEGVIHVSSHVSERVPLGKFKHILTTGNTDFEFRVHEKGVLRLLKEETKRKVEERVKGETSLNWEIKWL